MRPLKLLVPALLAGVLMLAVIVEPALAATTGSGVMPANFISRSALLHIGIYVLLIGGVGYSLARLGYQARKNGGEWWLTLVVAALFVILFYLRGNLGVHFY